MAGVEDRQGDSIRAAETALYADLIGEVQPFADARRLLGLLAGRATAPSTITARKMVLTSTPTSPMNAMRPRGSASRSRVAARSVTTEEAMPTTAAAIAIALTAAIHGSVSRSSTGVPEPGAQPASWNA